jgi:hypothetical protein
LACRNYELLKQLRRLSISRKANSMMILSALADHHLPVYGAAKIFVRIRRGDKNVETPYNGIDVICAETQRTLQKRLLPSLTVPARGSQLK